MLAADKAALETLKEVERDLTGSAESDAKEGAPSGPLVLFSVHLSLGTDGSVGYSPPDHQWEALLVSFVSKPADVLASIGGLLDEPVLQEYIPPQPISADVGANAAAAAAAAAGTATACHSRSARTRRLLPNRSSASSTMPHRA